MTTQTLAVALLLGVLASVQAADEAPLLLDDISIIGNRERPRAVTIVPWRQAPGADLLGRPGDSVLDEQIAPLEREVFRREIEYATAANPQSGQ